MTSVAIFALLRDDKGGNGPCDRTKGKRDKALSKVLSSATATMARERVSSDSKSQLTVKQHNFLTLQCSKPLALYFDQSAGRKRDMCAEERHQLVRKRS